MVSCKTLPQGCPSWREESRGDEEMDVLKLTAFPLVSLVSLRRHRAQRDETRSG